MEDIFGLLVTLAIYLIAASASAKKKKTKKRTQAERARERRSTQTQRGFVEAFEQERKAAFEEPRQQKQPFEVQRPACDTQRIHLHEATQEQMNLAAEGEDPCHAAGVDPLQTEDDSAIDAPVRGEVNPIAQDMLRGVIMSEILTRPCERMPRGRRIRRV